MPKDKLYDAKVKDIYIRAITGTPSAPTSPWWWCNDGDVSALAGAMSLGENNVLGIAMGTSEAVGYVDEKGNITGWLNELAFVPVDVNPDAMEDEWSGDIGCGVKYFSQDGVIKLAPRAGINLSESLSPAEKLKEVQKPDGSGRQQRRRDLPLHRHLSGPRPGLLLRPVSAAGTCCSWAGSCPARAAT